MASITNLIFTLAAGSFAGYVLLKLKVPGGMLVGAIIGVAAINILLGRAYMPSAAKVGAQIIAGSCIGSSVGKSDLIRLKHIYKPVATILTAALILNLVTGFIIYAIGPLDLMTSLMCCVPGGISDMPLIAGDLGADTPKVTAMQFLRMSVEIGIFPGLISAIGNSQRSEDLNTVNTASEDNCRIISPDTGEKRKYADVKTFALTFIFAAISGILGKICGLPAGAMVGSLLGVLIFKLLYGGSYMPRWLKIAAQAASGVYIGCSVGIDDLIELRYLAAPALIMLTGYFINCVVTGTILHRRYKMPLKVSMLAVTPAGASDMALIAADMNIVSTDLIVLQIVRLVAVTAVFPQIMNLIINIIQ
jgi:membrane AbrB-like protein